MEVQLESTTKIVRLTVSGVEVPARIWQGHTKSGIEVFAYIALIAARDREDLFEFDHELLECVAPVPLVQEIPARLLFYTGD